MAIILDLSEKSRERAVDHLTNEAWSLGEALAVTPQSVEGILSTPKNKLTVINQAELEQFVFHELFLRTKEGQELTSEYILALQYIAKYISHLGVNENSSYVHDAVSDGDYKRAGDTAVFGYIHFVGKRRNPLSHEDYMQLAIQCYLRWYDRQPQSLGYVVATQVPTILPKLQNWRMDMMDRVPAFSIVG